MRRSLALVLIPTTFLAPAACITERTGPASSPPPGLTFRSATPSAPLAGPVARPVSPDATTISRFAAAITPLGTVPYDGQVLPLFSPDGRHMAVQQGRAPSWETLLALPGAAAPATTLRAYAVLETRLEPLAWEGTSDLLLGRSADDDGFVIESPRPDGSRWIGRIAWGSGALTWLVHDAHVNAHAVLSNRGDLAYTRSVPGSGRAELVCVPTGGSPATDGVVWRPENRAGVEQSCWFPVYGSGSEIVYVLTCRGCEPGVMAQPGTLDLLALSATHPEASSTPSGSQPPGQGTTQRLSIVASTTIAPSGTPLMAYQATASLQVPATPVSEPTTRDLDRSGFAGAPSQPDERIVFFSANTMRMNIFQPRQGLMYPLVEGSVAAVSLSSWILDGYAVATPDGLFFQSSPNQYLSDIQNPPIVPLLGGTTLARTTTDPSRRMLVVRPSPKLSDRVPHLQIVTLRPE